MKDYSNYHQTNFTAKLLRDGIKSFERSLETSPDSHDVEVNGKIKQIMIQSTSKYNERRILFKKGDIVWGDLVIHEDEKWLVTERPYFNKIHEKSKMELCNNAMKFEVEPEPIDFDEYGNEIFDPNAQSTTREFPCVIADLTKTDLSSSYYEKINISEGMMVLLISYTNDKVIKLNAQFEMFGEDYRINGIDKSNVLNDQGILRLFIKKI